MYVNLTELRANQNKLHMGFEYVEIYKKDPLHLLDIAETQNDNYII